MSKHTPGPWTQGFSKAGKECVWLDGRIEPQNGMGLNSTWIDCGTEANARLIAAAPDLLEALKHLEHNAAKSGADMGLALDVARAAITKATNNPKGV